MIFDHSVTDDHRGLGAWSVCVFACLCTSRGYQDEVPRSYWLVGPTIVTPAPGSELEEEESSDSNFS